MVRFMATRQPRSRRDRIVGKRGAVKSAPSIPVMPLIDLFHHLRYYVRWRGRFCPNDDSATKAQYCYWRNPPKCAGCRADSWKIEGQQALSLPPLLRQNARPGGIRDITMHQYGRAGNWIMAALTASNVRRVFAYCFTSDHQESIAIHSFEVWVEQKSFVKTERAGSSKGVPKYQPEIVGGVDVRLGCPNSGLWGWTVISGLRD